MATRASVEARAATIGIELEVTVDRAGKTAAFDGSNVHAFAPDGMAFSGSSTGSASLWDGPTTSIDWGAVDRALSGELPLINADPELEEA